MKHVLVIGSFLMLMAMMGTAMAATTVSGSGFISLLITVVIFGLILWLCWWFVGYVQLPQPFDKVARVLIGLVALIFLINILLQIGGMTPMFRIG